jgi:hypothetical protein
MWIQIQRPTQPASLVNGDAIASIDVIAQLQPDPAAPTQYALLIQFVGGPKTLMIAVTNPPAPAPPQTLAQLNALRNQIWTFLSTVPLPTFYSVPGTDLPPIGP